MHQQQHQPHHTIQAAGIQLQQAVAHMLVCGIHQPHTTWPTVPTTRAHRPTAAAAAHHRQHQPPRNHRPTRLSSRLAQYKCTF